MKRLLIPLLLILLTVAGYSGYQLFQYSQASQESEIQMAQIRQLVANNPTEADRTTPASVTAMDFRPLEVLNPDVVGWIRIPGTIIDYPVLQGEDNETYLGRDINGNDTKYGSIFLDSASRLDPRDENLILYGHHMKDGQMFGSLVRYQEQSYYKAHPVIEFTTPGDAGVYEIIAVFKTSVNDSSEAEYPYHSFKNFAGPEEFERFIAQIRSRSFYPIDAPVDFKDQLITLSTCEYTLDNGRLVVIARRRDPAK